MLVLLLPADCPKYLPWQRERFREGAAAYCNVSDLAQTQRNTTASSNEPMRLNVAHPPDTSSSTLLDSHTSLSTSLEAELDTSTKKLKYHQKSSGRHAPRAAAENTEPVAVTKLSKMTASLESEQESSSNTTRTRQTRSSTKPPPVEVVGTRAV